MKSGLLNTGVFPGRQMYLSYSDGQSHFNPELGRFQLLDKVCFNKFPVSKIIK